MWSQTHYDTKDDPELLAFPLVPPQCLVNGHAPPLMVHPLILEQLVIKTPCWALCQPPLYITPFFPLSSPREACQRLVSVALPSAEGVRERLRHMGSPSEGRG